MSVIKILLYYWVVNLLKLLTYYPSSPVQNSRTNQETKGRGKESKSISNELASAINDGLYFYEQVEVPIVL